jgi:peptidylprolyl isomerase
MARAADPDSGDCQFFICLDKASHLDGQYTVWGEVVEGMDHIDAIKKGSPRSNGMVEDPDEILSCAVAED